MIISYLDPQGSLSKKMGAPLPSPPVQFCRSLLQGHAQRDSHFVGTRQRTFWCYEDEGSESNCITPICDNERMSEIYAIWQHLVDLDSYNL